MSFESILQTVVDECGGGLGAALMGSDGIPIAEVQATQVRAGAPDVGTAGIEFARILSEIHKASDAIGGGASVETIVSLARVTLIFRSVGEDLFLVLAVRPDGNLGKARYLIRKQLLALRRLL